MKKRLMIVIFLIILGIDAAAMTVTLGGPTGTQTTNDVNFGCTVNAAGEELSSLSLWTNIGGTFQQLQVNNSAVIEGTEYTFTVLGLANGNYEWNCLATNRTGDSTFAGSNNTFTQSVIANNAPLFSAIPTQEWPETQPLNIILSDYFSDPDGDSLTYNSTSPANIAVSISGAIATLTPQNWHGSTTITFTANDGKGGLNSTSANLNVTHANRPPYNKTEYMGNISWTMDQTKKTDLNDYFADLDGDSLTYNSRFTSGSTHHINISIDNSTSEATMTPEQNWTGTEKIIFTAYDGQGGSLDSNELSLLVTSAAIDNTSGPGITSRSPQINPMMTVGNSQNFMITTFDADGDELTIIWKLNGNEQAESRDKDNYTFLATSEGTYSLDVTVSDDEGSTNENWAITVQGLTPPPEEPPEEPVTPTNICGNGVVNAGETCQTCPADVKCPLEYECKNNKCIREVKKSNWLLIVIVGGGFIIFAAATLLIYRYYKKKTLFGGWEPKYTGNAGAAKVETKPTQQPEAKVEKKEAPPLFDNKKKTVNEVMMKHFIESNLKKGETLEKIKEKLKKVGWSDEKINNMYDEVRQDQTFKK
jgi:hypothetical protein